MLNYKSELSDPVTLEVGQEDKGKSIELLEVFNPTTFSNVFGWKWGSENLFLTYGTLVELSSASSSQNAGVFRLFATEYSHGMFATTFSKIPGAKGVSILSKEFIDLRV